MAADSMTYIVPTKYQLRDKEFYRRRIWGPARKACKNLIGGRRAVCDAMELIYDYENQIFHKCGEPYRVPDIDGVFKDLDNRWMSLFLEADESGERPRRHSPKLDRLTLIRLYCMIREQIEFEEV